MMSTKKYIVIICSLFLTAISCERRTLEDDDVKTAKVPISINWAASGITPQNVSVLFYDQSDNDKLVLEHHFEHNTNEIQSNVEVPLGKYTVVVFNELRDQIDYINVRGYKQLSTLEFYATQKSKVRSRTRADGSKDSYINEPSDLATYIVRDFVVTSDIVTDTQNQINTKLSDTKSEQIKASAETLIGVVPIKRTQSMNITVNIKGLHNARMPALVDLRNISGSYFVNTDRNSDIPSTIQFMMNNRTYNEYSMTDGTISTINKTDPTKNTTITLFGVMGDRSTTLDQPESKPIELDMLFKLVDKEQTLQNRVANITTLIKFIKINELNVDVTIDEPLPDVKPEGSSESGFGSEIEDWETIEVPLNNDSN